MWKVRIKELPKRKEAFFLKRTKKERKTNKLKRKEHYFNKFDFYDNMMIEGDIERGRFKITRRRNCLKNPTISQYQYGM